jgi:serine/threonine protein kinase
MTPRDSYTPVNLTAQGLGGNNNLGILIVRYRLTGKKVIEKRVRPSGIQFGHVQREIRMMRLCTSHPNIVSLIDYDLSHTRLKYGSLFMQRGELGGLDALITRFRHARQFLTDEGFMWKVLWDLSIGIAYMHTGQDAVTVRQCAFENRTVARKSSWSPIYHRDLKPSNVFMTWIDPLGIDDVHYPTMLIGDFGCALMVTDRPARISNTPAGDVDFVPPETPRYSGAGDVFSLALVVVCLGLMKHAPPKDIDPLANNWASAGMYSVLSRCLQTKMRDRCTPADLPRYVWRGYQAWLRGSRNRGARLPPWALPR